MRKELSADLVGTELTTCGMIETRGIIVQGMSATPKGSSQWKN